MKFLIAVWVFYFCRLAHAQDTKTYLITAPKYLRLDASEKVVIQLFGYTEETSVQVCLKSSMDGSHTKYAEQIVTLNAQKQFQDAVTLRIFPNTFPKDATHAFLQVNSNQFVKHVRIPVLRKNGFLFIQTDKPIYTPEQLVKVRAFSLNEDLMPALRPVSLTFRDPELQKVEIVDLTDVNGIPSMQNPFKIPLKPKLGIWRIEASYTDEFITEAKAEFEVKEYVLPSISIIMEPEANYISFGTFESFKIKISARYIHGAPVVNGDVFLRFGYIEQKPGQTAVLLHNSRTIEQMSESGDVEVNINIKKALSSEEGPKELKELLGKSLYVAVMVKEPTGGISQEAELAGVKFLMSPYSLSLVATPPFIKPGLPYTIRVSVKDHLGEPVAQTPVRFVESSIKENGAYKPHQCFTNTANYNRRTNNDGTAIFICNIPFKSESAKFIFKTTDEKLPPSSQAEYTLEAVAYSSPNERYLYIDLPFDYAGLQVGSSISIMVYFHARSYLQFENFSYQIISRGKIVKFATEKHFQGSASQAINFQVTRDMVPSIRLLVYYMIYGESTSELVADSVWIDVREKCVNGLKTEVSFYDKEYKPKQNLTVEVKTGQDALVALSAVDTAVYSIRASQDPLTRVLRQIEQSDLGCGGGGGKDNADVFRLAGLTFMTNANAQVSQSEDDKCTAAVRPKRDLSIEQKKNKAKQYGSMLRCCVEGLHQIPTLESCVQRASRVKDKNRKNHDNCRKVFTECCEYNLKELQGPRENVLGRTKDFFPFDLQPTQIRSYFPESWLWEVQPVRDRSGQVTLRRTLPDSLTTWEIKAIGMFKKEGSSGICVADPIRVSVTQAVSIDVPLPYSMVRGEQIELKGSVYNRADKTIQYCVTLTAGPGVCLFPGKPTKGNGKCNEILTLDSGSVGLVTFTLMALEVGSHALTFTLRSNQLGKSDQIVKTLRVVPEGIRIEEFIGGKLDPRGLYGSSIRTVELKYSLPSQLVPKTSVERLITINGEILGEVLAILENPDGLNKLVNLPSGSAEGEIMKFMPVYFVYHYLETANRWDIMGPEKYNHPFELKRKIKEGITSIQSFRIPLQFSYSMWKNKEASTWLTALVVKTLGQVDKYTKVDSDMLSNSIFWLINEAQNVDGSFTEYSTYTPVKLMSKGANANDQSVYLTSFVIIGIKTAMKVEKCDLMEFGEAVRKAAEYVSEHASLVKSMFARAVAAYALTLVDRDSMPSIMLYESLEKNAREKGEPVEYRYWQEKDATQNPLTPDKASAHTVETTAYVLLTALIKAKNQYARPILNWLTQDQRYGGGFHSTQDTMLTLEALAEYSSVVKSSTLDLLIEATYIKTNERLAIIALTQKKPVGNSIEVSKDKDVRVTTGYGSGVAIVKMKTVYYKTTETNEMCNFDISIKVHSPDLKSKDSMLHSARIVACAKYKPRQNEVFTEASHTVMEIQLPTGMQPFQEDLNMFLDGLESVISDYKITEDMVVLHLDSVPSEQFLCVGFRIQSLFQVGMVGASLFKVYEFSYRESQCSKLYSNSEAKLLRLCVEEQCHCMAAECCNFKSNMDGSITADDRKQATCDDSINYAFKVKIKSIVTEGDFISYVANMLNPLKMGLENHKINTELEFVKKASCTSVDMKTGGQYFIMGADRMQIQVGRSYKYRYPLDSQATVEVWPSECGGSPTCIKYVDILDKYAENVLIDGCKQQ